MDSVVDSGLLFNSFPPVCHIDTYSSNDCSPNPPKMLEAFPSLTSDCPVSSPKILAALPSPSPSVSDGADETLLPISPTLPLSPLSPEDKTPNKRTAEDADLSDDLCCKRPRNGEKALTPVSQTSFSILAEETFPTLQTPTKPQTPKQSFPHTPKKANTPKQPYTPKRVKYTLVEPYAGSLKRQKLEAASKLNSDEPTKDIKRKRKLQREEHSKIKSEPNEDYGTSTPRKNKSVAEAEKRARVRFQRGISKNRKESPSSLTVKIKARGLPLDGETTETDEDSKVKALNPQHEKAQNQAPQIELHDNPSTPKKKLATPESSCDNQTQPDYVKRQNGVGLLNLGNTCFGNTIIQALCNSPRFRELLMKTQYSWSNKKDRKSNHIRKSAATAPVRRTRRATKIQEDKERAPVPDDTSLCCELGELFHCMVYDHADVKPSKRTIALSPHEFCDTMTAVMPIFERHIQHDAQEFFQLALQRMGKELELEKIGKFGNPGAIDGMNEQASPIYSLFGGQCINTNKCNGCAYSTSNKESPEAFLSLGLGIPLGPDEQEATKGRKSTRVRQPKTVTLESCFEQFISPEFIHPNENSGSSDNSTKEPFCKDCGFKEGINKSSKLSKCPDYLCVHFKRFQWENGRSHKVSTIVKPPMEEFDIAPYMAEDCITTSTKYLLHSVVVHEGDRCDAGHYIVYTKHEDGTWWKKNDDKVSKVSADEVSNKQAYMLFFSRSGPN